MAIRTTAIDLAKQRGWTIVELSRRTGLSLRTLYYLRDGRQPSTETVQALRATFPEIEYDSLFVSSNCTTGQLVSTTVEVAA